MIYECSCGRLSTTKTCPDCRRGYPLSPPEINVKQHQHDCLHDDYGEESDPDSIPYEASNRTRLTKENNGGEKRQNGERMWK